MTINPRLVSPLARSARRKPVARRGAMMVFVVVLMVAFIGAAALMIGVAQMQLARTELRASTDAAAKAAAQQLSLSLNQADAIRVARDVAALNTVNNEPLQLAVRDFEFGRSLQDNTGRFVFSRNQSPVNSVRLTGSRTAESRSGAIPFFLGGVFDATEFEPVETAMATYIERDVVLVIDRSGSMLGSKFRDLQQAIRIFTETLDDTPVIERVGLASYSGSATQDVQLTTDLRSVDNAVNRLAANGSTSISGGMAAGRAIMRGSRSPIFVERTMIVMTDGIHNTGVDPRVVARQLAAENVDIHTITFGAGADQARMREIARIGRGRFFHAVNGAQLREIYEEIARTLSTILTD